MFVQTVRNESEQDARISFLHIPSFKWSVQWILSFGSVTHESVPSFLLSVCFAHADPMGRSCCHEQCPDPKSSLFTGSCLFICDFVLFFYFFSFLTSQDYAMLVLNNITRLQQQQQQLEQQKVSSQASTNRGFDSNNNAAWVDTNIRNDLKGMNVFSINFSFKWMSCILSQ